MSVPKRSPTSHKGENGKVYVIGGSRYIHGAPIFAALAAEKAGADLLFVSLPDWHENVARIASLNFQVYPFQDDLIADYNEFLLALLATMDSCVIGPGIDKDNRDSIEALEALVDGCSCPMVLDATALQPSTLKACTGKTAVLTPHLGELERMNLKEADLGKAAKEHGVTILLKGPEDRIAGPDGNVEVVKGGSACLTVGGTGDVLGGYIAGLIAQGMDPTKAAIEGSKRVKKAGEELEEKEQGRCTANEVTQKL